MVYPQWSWSVALSLGRHSQYALLVTGEATWAQVGVELRSTPQLYSFICLAFVLSLTDAHVRSGGLLSARNVGFWSGGLLLLNRWSSTHSIISSISRGFLSLIQVTSHGGIFLRMISASYMSLTSSLVLHSWIQRWLHCCWCLQWVTHDSCGNFLWLNIFCL